jgi:hypothetical protein
MAGDRRLRIANQAITTETKAPIQRKTSRM